MSSHRVVLRYCTHRLLFLAILQIGLAYAFGIMFALVVCVIDDLFCPVAHGCL